MIAEIKRYRQNGGILIEQEKNQGLSARLLYHAAGAESADSCGVRNLPGAGEYTKDRLRGKLSAGAERKPGGNNLLFFRFYVIIPAYRHVAACRLQNDLTG